MGEVITSIAAAAFNLLAEMAPYLLLGMLIAGAMHVLLPVDLVARQLGGNRFGATLRAALLGIPLPICSCGVVPVAASLKKSGAGNGAVISFLVTTPTTGVDSILATYSLLGLPIAIARVAASFVIGLAAGIATSLGAPSPHQKPVNRLPTVALEQTNRVVSALKYSLGELMGGIAKPLAIGTIIGGLITYLVPPGLLEQYVGQGFLSYLVMMAIGIPLYVCASGSIPLAAALLVKGISPGAALVFLIAGPATNVATVTVISDMLGKRALVIYLGFLMVGSLATGYITDAVFQVIGIGLVPVSAIAAHNHHTLMWWQLMGGIAMTALMIYHMGKKLIVRLVPQNGGEDMFRMKVPDMNCQHCASSIKSAVCGISGVKQVDADPSTKLVSIDLDDDADQEAISKAIAEAGFHPEPVELTK